MADGKFKEGSVSRVDSSDIIAAINELLRSTQPILDMYNVDQINKDFAEIVSMLATDQIEY